MPCSRQLWPLHGTCLACACACVTSLVCCLQDEINSLRADQKAVLSVCACVTSLVCCVQDEINSLRADQKAVLSEKELHERECSRLQTMYENEVRLREKLMERLERASAGAQTVQVL